jgi:O-antigen biosynthesis protein
MPSATNTRPQTHGRSILAQDRKLHVRGVTYGSFGGTNAFPTPQRAAADLAAMAASGLNALRTYDVPPRWLLDLAAENELRVLAGIPWEQHVTFLDERGRARRIAARVREGVAACSGHPAILAYAVGNEIPASIVRWHGRRQVENFIERLYLEAKDEDPEGLVTYVNFPSTEYLELPFLDLVSFNVFLEGEEAFESYLARLQNIAGNRPLLVTEAGLDSRRHGQKQQAEALRWQIRHSFATGAAGVFVFSWTDEWRRGGAEIVDWEFGVVDRARKPKVALDAIEDAFDQTPFPDDADWPRISAVVCTHNGERTLPQCLERLARLDYPDYETIVVSDGSIDRSEEIAREHGARLVRIEHGGLSAARNAGLAAASGEIVAFLDDDAYPDPDWLRYLAASFRSSAHAAIGGPNVPPEDEALVAEAVAAAPGAPIHVLTNDREAEHIPGCNMAFRRADLEAVGGFDEQFRIAGDDVDICWRLQDAGHSVGFNAGAVVMHRRRDSVRRYLRQQFEYGKAEALLEAKWPARYNRAGYARWSGRIYGGLAVASRRRGKVEYGTWGGGLFQSIYEPGPSLLRSLPLMPEAYLALVLLAALSALGMLWAPLLAALPGLVAALGLIGWEAIASAWQAHYPRHGESRLHLAAKRGLTALLFVCQPVARLGGRLWNGLSPWRRRSAAELGRLRPATLTVWRESWQAPRDQLERLERLLLERSAVVMRGGVYDRWDLQARLGAVGSARMRSVVEEHGSGRQLLRVRVWPTVSVPAALVLLAGAALAVIALLDGVPAVAASLGAIVAGGLLLTVRDCRAATGAIGGALESYASEAPPKTAQEAAPGGPLEVLGEELDRIGQREPVASARVSRRARAGRRFAARLAGRAER